MSMGSLNWMWLRQIVESGPDPIPPPPPAPAVTLPELKEPEVPDKDVSETNAGKTDEKRRILAALPKATKTNLGDTGEQGGLAKKRLLGSGGAGNTTLG
jgi:hypothetical protein